MAASSEAIRSPFSSAGTAVSVAVWPVTWMGVVVPKQINSRDWERKTNAYGVGLLELVYYLPVP